MDSSGSSSSRSGNDYSSTLIGTVSELRMELQRTMIEIQSVKDQNRALMSNNQIIKNELLDTRRNYAEAYENYMATVTEKLEAERQNEAFMDRLKSQLLEKTKEFDLMRDKNSPQDIDTIRIKVQEELEIPHREKVMKVQNELQDQKSRTSEMKRQFDVLKTDFEVMLKSSQREVASLKDQYDQVERRHRDEMMRMQDKEMSPEKDEQTIRMQSAQLNEYKHIAEKLKEEVRVMRQIKDDTVFALDQSEANREESCVQLRARATIAESDRLALEHKLINSSSEIERKETALRSTKLEVEQLTYQLDEAKRQLTELEARLVRSTADYACESQSTKAQHDTEMQELEQQLSQDKIHDREELVRRAQRLTTEMQLRAETVESDLRKSNQIRTQEMNKRLSVLEIELAEEKNVRKINEYEGKQTLSELSIEFEVQRSELTRIVREKDVLHERLRDVEGKYESDKKQSIQYRKDTAATILTMDKTVKEYKINVAELEGRILKAKSIDLDNQYKSQIMVSNMDALKTEQSAFIDAIKKESQIRATDMEKLYIEKLEKIKENAREALDKERKRAEGYKVKAQDAQRRGKVLSDTALAAAASSYGIDYMSTPGLNL